MQFVLLNDQSGSSKWPAGTAQQAFFEDVLLKTLMVPGVDRGSLLNYNDEFYFDAQNVSDPAVISGKIVRAGRGGTATHDAIVRAGKWLQKQPLNSDGRKLMFLFTDGDVDNASTCSFKPALDEILKTGIPVFVIVPRSSKPLPETSHLADIASKTGGEIYFVGPQDSGTQAFSFLRRELDNSFMITIDVPQEVEKGLQKLSIKTKTESFSVQAPEDIWIDK
ncbi:MAG: vWA domain-containing protein [Terriglobales bacterium]